MSWADELIRQVTASAVAAIASILAGFFFTWLNRRQRKAKQITESQIEVIAHAAKGDEGSHQNIIASMERLASTTASKEVGVALEQIRTELARSLPEKSVAVENLISGYHEQALSQANAQFWFSVAAASAGFVWILYSGVDIKPEI